MICDTRLVYVLPQFARGLLLPYSRNMPSTPLYPALARSGVSDLISYTPHDWTACDSHLPPTYQWFHCFTNFTGVITDLWPSLLTQWILIDYVADKMRLMGNISWIDLNDLVQLVYFQWWRR